MSHLSLFIVYLQLLGLHPSAGPYPGAGTAFIRAAWWPAADWAANCWQPARSEVGGSLDPLPGEQHGPGPGPGHLWSGGYGSRASPHQETGTLSVSDVLLCNNEIIFFTIVGVIQFSNQNKKHVFSKERFPIFLVPTWTASSTGVRWSCWLS